MSSTSRWRATARATHTSLSGRQAARSNPRLISLFAAMHFVDNVEDGSNELAGVARQALMRGWAQWQTLDDEIAWFDRQIAEHASHRPAGTALHGRVWLGRLTASAAVATVVDARQFKNGRQMAAWLGIVPRQKSSGGKQWLGSITKQGDDYLRTLLFQGARSALLTAHRRHDRLSRWIVELQARVGYYKALVAVANKHARILWAALAKGERFDPFHHAPARTGGAAGA